MNPEPSCTPSVEVHESIHDVPAAAWDALSNRVNPFFEHAFLAAAEDSGIVGEGTGWIPRYLVARDGADVVGATPLFLKYDSYGEFIFDWSWADAYRRAGLFLRARIRHDEWSTLICR